MTCPRCRSSYEDSRVRCPRCGAANRRVKGTYQTSTVLISSGGSDRVYRSVDEVPAPLRTLLMKSTTSANSATILIADRRGRREIARAMRNLPGGPQRRLLRAIAGVETAPAALSRLTLTHRKLIAAALALLTIAAIVLVFTRLG
jgi:hypothetical protein